MCAINCNNYGQWNVFRSEGTIGLAAVRYGALPIPMFFNDTSLVLPSTVSSSNS